MTHDKASSILLCANFENGPSPADPDEGYVVAMFLEEKEQEILQLDPKDAEALQDLFIAWNKETLNQEPDYSGLDWY